MVALLAHATASSAPRSTSRLSSSSWTGSKTAHVLNSSTYSQTRRRALNLIGCSLMRNALMLLEACSPAVLSEVCPRWLVICLSYRVADAMGGFFDCLYSVSETRALHNHLRAEVIVSNVSGSCSIELTAVCGLIRKDLGEQTAVEFLRVVCSAGVVPVAGLQELLAPKRPPPPLPAPSERVKLLGLPTRPRSPRRQRRAAPTSPSVPLDTRSLTRYASGLWV